MIIEHHKNIHVIHEENNRNKLEQYTKPMKQQVKRFQICSTHCYEHTGVKSTLIEAKTAKI
jgi:hypothetical protein